MENLKFKKFKKDFTKENFFIGYDEYKKYGFLSTEYETSRGYFYIITDDISYERKKYFEENKKFLRKLYEYKSDDYIMRRISFFDSIKNNANNSMLYLYGEDNEIAFVKYKKTKKNMKSSVLFIKNKKYKDIDIPLVYSYYLEKYIFDIERLIEYFGTNNYFRKIYETYVEDYF